jgi:hypothetical protein
VLNDKLGAFFEGEPGHRPQDRREDHHGREAREGRARPARFVRKCAMDCHEPLRQASAGLPVEGPRSRAGSTSSRGDLFAGGSAKQGRDRRPRRSSRSWKDPQRRARVSTRCCRLPRSASLHHCALGCWIASLSRAVLRHHLKLRLSPGSCLGDRTPTDGSHIRTLLLIVPLIARCRRSPRKGYSLHRAASSLIAVKKGKKGST